MTQPPPEPGPEAGRDVDLLTSTLATTAEVLAGVDQAQYGLPTPCEGFDVRKLVDHLVGWAASFAARMGGDAVDGDPDDFHAGPDPAAQFRVSAEVLVDAYRSGSAASQKLPAGMLLMEFLTHGWDLAVATGQHPAFDVDAATLALDTGRLLLKPEYRGEGKPFGEEVAPRPDADPVDRVVAYLGRDPSWSR